MNSYSRIIKARDVKLTDAREEPRTGFVRGLGVPPGDDRWMREELPGKAPAITQEEAARETAARQAAADRRACEELKESLERERKHLSLASESVAKLMRELETLKEKILHEAEREILNLVFLVAGKVVHREVREDSDVILSVLRDAMKNVRVKEDIRIRMHPEDYRHMTEAHPDFLAGFGDIAIEKDEKIGRGGAIVESPAWEVDARVDQQLDKIRETLGDERGF